MRIAPAVASLLFAASGFFASAVPAMAGGSCTGWTSTSIPPTSIRVGRVSEGFVSRVNFRYYVEKVASREWPDSLPYQAERAGAQAVKQYAWYWSLAGRWRGGSINGQCYDVVDTTNDQLYKPETSVSDWTKDVVDSVWWWTVWRNGNFVNTWYNYGDDVPCARDANGRLHERSSRKCAANGWSAKHILEVYYSGSVRT